jgi:uncharacterized protein (UPF0332 family)
MSTKNASIQLKLNKAKNLLAEVDVLVDHKFYMTAINRLYYRCFHATKALLLTKDLIPKTHSGTVSMLHQYFVKNGIFDFDQASFFSRLMQERVEDDYNDLLKIDEAEIWEFVEPAKKYVFYVEDLIRNWEQNKN